MITWLWCIISFFPTVLVCFLEGGNWKLCCYLIIDLDDLTYLHSCMVLNPNMVLNPRLLLALLTVFQLQKANMFEIMVILISTSCILKFRNDFINQTSVKRKCPFLYHTCWRLQFVSPLLLTQALRLCIFQDWEKWWHH